VGKRYCVGADPAQGNPTSDDSALVVMDVATGEEVASLAGRLEPAVFASVIDAVGRWYNDAAVMVERNNHGHAVLLWLRDNSVLRRLYGHDGQPGWGTTTKSKALLYDHTAANLRAGEVVVHGLDVYTQLASVDGSTLAAPSGQRDDLAMAFALAVAGCIALLTQQDDELPPMGCLVPGKQRF
jgi:hypothetical protein